MRVQGVVLEDHRDVALARVKVVDDAAADLDPTVRHVLEPGDHPQHGRLAAAGRTDEHDELAVGDLEVEPVNSLRPVGVDLAHV